MTEVRMTSGAAGKTFFSAAHRLSGLELCKYQLVGKEIKLTTGKNIHWYHCWGYPNYIHTRTKQKMLLLQVIFGDLNEYFYEIDSDDLNLDPLSKHIMKGLSSLPMTDAIDISNERGWLDNTVIQPQSTVNEYDAEKLICDEFDNTTEYRIGYEDPKPY